MKAITLTQPWASLVVRGYKVYETRSWRAYHRGGHGGGGAVFGPLAIHASATFPGEAKLLCREEPFRSRLREAGYVSSDPERQGAESISLPVGCVVGVVQVEECLSTGSEGGAEPRWLRELSDEERAFGNFSPGRWAWRLSAPVELPVFVPCRGHLGLWKLPHTAEAIVLAGLAQRGYQIGAAKP